MVAIPNKVARRIIVPAVMLAAIVAFRVLMSMGHVPEADEVTRGIMELFRAHGALIVISASIVEHLSIVNALFPGSTLILTAMASTSGSPLHALWMYILIVSTGTITNIANYFIGRLGESRERVRFRDFLVTMCHPQLGSVTCTRCGSARLPFALFVRYLVLSIVPWYAVWAVLMYTMGSLVSGGGDLLLAITAAYVLVWIVRELKGNAAARMT